MANQSSLEFTPAVLARLKVEYKKCVERGDETFMFDDVELVVGYAKYLIEHLENVFKGGE